MNTRRVIASAALCLSVAVISSHADKFVSASIGPIWPSILFKTDSKTAWNASVIGGSLIDKKVGYGMGLDFLWNLDETRTDSAGRAKVVESESSFMFPISAFFLLDPLPDLIVHPAAQVQIGYNSMVYTHKIDSSASSSRSDNGYYFGFIFKSAVDGVYDVADNASLFLGMQYQWADTRSFADKQGTFTPRDMSGFGLRAGFRAAY